MDDIPDGRSYETIFLEQIGENYNELKSNLENLCKRRNIVFDEDVFHDTILKCARCVGHKMTKGECKKYLIGSYNINILREFEYSRNRDTVYDSDYTDIHIVDNCSIVEKIDVRLMHEELYKKFDKRLVKLFIDWCNGYTVKELEKKSHIQGLQYQFNKFRKFLNKLMVNQ